MKKRFKAYAKGYDHRDALKTDKQVTEEITQIVMHLLLLGTKKYLL